MNWNEVIKQLLAEAKAYSDLDTELGTARDRKNLQNAEILTSLAAALLKGLK